MSTVFVHVGQAGCQLAEELWLALAKERPGSPDIFGHGQSRGAVTWPRAVLVDSEPKVVSKLLSARFGASGGEGFAFDASSAAWSQSGRGGNFALGYSGEGGTVLSTGSPELLTQALEAVRRQLEACHGTHLGTVLTHSLGGGTGSGLGSRLAEEIRDLCPSSPLLTVSVLPISSGENPAQCFNSLLALATLQDVVDGVVLYENDRLVSTIGGDASRSRAGIAEEPPPESGGCGARLSIGWGRAGLGSFGFLCYL